DHTDLDRLHAAVKREHPELQPGNEPSPLWVFVASMAAMIFGGGYAGAYVSGFEFENNSPFVGKPHDVRPVVVQDGPALDPFALAMKKGASVYNNCQGCHQASGTGQPGLIPPLAGSEWVLGGTERLVRLTLHGLSGTVTVKGTSYTNVMPPQGHLSDKELSYVLTYIRNSWGNQATMVTPEMVTKAREDAKDHVGPWTQADLEPFKDKNIPGEIPAGPGATVQAAAPVTAK
ncbi:MAG: c-type cytochrome, partial [Verrucomicrobiaceae bacterium]